MGTERDTLGSNQERIAFNDETTTNEKSLRRKAGILNQYSHRTPSITTEPQVEAIRRPHVPDDIKYREQILKTIESAITEGRTKNTTNVPQTPIHPTQQSDRPNETKKPNKPRILKTIR